MPWRDPGSGGGGSGVPAIIPAAIGDGVTDDLAIIQSTLNAAAAGGDPKVACVVYLLAGKVYALSNTLVIPDRVLLAVLGRGRGASHLLAGAGFPINTPLVRLAPLNPATGFGCRLEGLTVDSNHIAGSIGVYTEAAQEGSGLTNCLIANYRDTGFKNVSGGLNITAQFNEFFPSNLGANYGINVTNGNVGLYNNSFVGTATAGIRLTSCVAFVAGVHVEGHTIGVNCGGGANAFISSVDGPTSLAAVTDCVRLDGGDERVTVHNVRKANATNALSDFGNSYTNTDANLIEYVNKSMSLSGIQYAPRNSNGPAVTIDASLCTYWTTGTLTAATTISAPSNPVLGRILVISFLQDATGGRTVSWNAIFHGITLAASGTANQRAIIEVQYDGAVWIQKSTSGWVA